VYAERYLLSDNQLSFDIFQLYMNYISRDHLMVWRMLYWMRYHFRGKINMVGTRTKAVLVGKVIYSCAYIFRTVLFEFLFLSDVCQSVYACEFYLNFSLWTKCIQGELWMLVDVTFDFYLISLRDAPADWFCATHCTCTCILKSYHVSNLLTQFVDLCKYPYLELVFPVSLVWFLLKYKHVMSYFSCYY
jgi:hypothetical protein